MILLTLMKMFTLSKLIAPLAIAVTTVQEHDFIDSPTYPYHLQPRIPSGHSQNWTAFDYKAKLLVVIYILKYVLSFLLARLSGRTMRITNLYFVGGGSTQNPPPIHLSKTPLCMPPFPQYIHFNAVSSTHFPQSHRTVTYQCSIAVSWRFWNNLFQKLSLNTNL